MIDINSLEDSIKDGEKKIHNLRPNVEKQILWADKSSTKTKISLVFIHGFSATRAELSPVIENVGKALKANVFLTRLSGHGQDGRSLGKASLNEWLKDTIEAIKIGEILGDRVVVIGSSTGCSLIHTTIEQELKIKAVIYVSPNFGPISYKAHILRVPGAKWFLPLLFGREHSFVPKNAEHERCWTTKYPTYALLAVKDSVVAASKIKHKKIKLPILFWFSDEDKIVSSKATRKVISKIGSNASVYNPKLASKDDPSKHGVLGDILSPSQTKIGVDKIVTWLKKNI